jgi:hypothetical protein
MKKLACLLFCVPLAGAAHAGTDADRAIACFAFAMQAAKQIGPIITADRAIELTVQTCEPDLLRVAKRDFPGIDPARIHQFAIDIARDAAHAN